MTREEAIDIIKCLAWHTRPNEEDIEQAIKVLEQEPFMNKPCVAHQVCHEDKVKVLDKIKTEIDNINLNEVALKYENRFYGFQREVIKIIDKYKAESEE